MAELALNDVERHALASHFHRVGVTELMRREAAPHAGLGGDAPQLRPGCGS